MTGCVKNCLLADGQADGILGIVEKDGELLIPHPRLGAEAAPPLFNDNAPLLVDLIGIESHPLRPVAQNLKRLHYHLRTVCGHSEHIDRLIKTGIGVEVWTETHADGFHIVHQFLFREVLGAVESHVFYEMSDTLLIIIFQYRTGVHHQPQFGTLFRFLINTNEVLQSVLKNTCVDLWIERQYLILLRHHLFRLSQRRRRRAGNQMKAQNQ